MSSLRRGCETNIGLTYRMLTEQDPSVSTTVYYEPGIQWRGWKRAHEVVAGIGIDPQIRRSYLFLARNFKPGDRIVLMGFSRGAYAVRSLAGLIDKMGLLRPAQISEANLRRVYDFYRSAPDGPEAMALKASLCHASVEIAFLGVYDTVRALGVRWPVLWRITGTPHPYHNHALGPHILQARQALAMQERRAAYAPVMWRVPEARIASVQQMWFRGTHGDVGGHILGRTASRRLSNIPLLWMLGEAEAAGLLLPLGWRNGIETDADAPSIGPYAGWSKLFLARRRRTIGADASERVHPSAADVATRSGLALPVGTPTVSAG